MELSALIGTAVLTVMLVIFLSVIALIISFFRKQDNQTKLGIADLLRIYAYLMRFISLIGLAIGVAILLKPVFAYFAGYQFSYRIEAYYDRSEPLPGLSEDGKDQMRIPAPVYDNNDVIEINGQKYYANFHERNQDILNGATLTAFMALVYIIHYLVSRKLDDAKNISLEKRTYLFTGLIYFSIVSIVGIPAAIYQVINYYTTDLKSTPLYSQMMPGEGLAIALVVLPLWIAFIWQLSSAYKKEK